MQCNANGKSVSPYNQRLNEDEEICCLFNQNLITLSSWVPKTGTPFDAISPSESGVNLSLSFPCNSWVIPSLSRNIGEELQFFSGSRVIFERKISLRKEEDQIFLLKTLDFTSLDYLLGYLLDHDCLLGVLFLKEKRAAGDSLPLNYRPIIKRAKRDNYYRGQNRTASSYCYVSWETTRERV